MNVPLMNVPLMNVPLMNVPFNDLKREALLLKDRINDLVNTTFYEKNDFILGEEVKKFETNFSKYIGTKYCLGVGNGTDALEIAVNSLALDNEDEIIVQANTYIATCLSVVNNNKKLKLVDVNKDTYQLDLDLLEKNITNKTKVLIIVHLTGSCCNMDKLMEIVEKNNILLIEDCAQCHGAYFKDGRLGTYGILSTFSFYPGKNLGAFGDGGAICMNDIGLYEKILKIRNNGSNIKYDHEIFGRNSRLDTIQAGILNIKLSHLDENNEKRRKHTNLYKELLCHNENIVFPKIEDNCIPVYHLFMIRVKKRDELKTYLEDRGVSVGIHYPICIPKAKCFKDKFVDNFLNSEELSEKILSLPMFPDLKREEIEYVCNLLVKFYQ
jgi:dTDP-4-amino-4,6-dideoxygalactose transaminase